LLANDDGLSLAGQYAGCGRDCVGCRHFKNMALNPSLKYMPKYSGRDYELKVSRVKMDDKGEYIVRAVNSFGSKEESAVLNVERTSRHQIPRIADVTRREREREREREFISQINGGLPDKAFVHRAGHP